MNQRDISAYWQAYSDLIELWAKGIWGGAEIGNHFIEHGKNEGRSIPPESLEPQSWSDWLYFANQQNSFNWWWRKGVIDSGVYSAILDGPESLDKGRIEKNKDLQKSSSLSSFALAQIAQSAHSDLGGGPLPHIASHNLQWAEPKSIGILPMREAIQSAFSQEYGYVILLPWLESGGAELVGMWHYRAAKELGLNPLIILADKPNVTARFAAMGLNILNLPELFEATMGKPYAHLARHERMEVLTTTIEVIQPDIMHLIHSYIGYSALTAPATQQRIREACNTIFVSAFCPHIHPTGNYDGYFREIPNLVDVVDQFVFDNDWYLDEMAKTYALPAAQSVAIKYPVEGLAAPAKSKVTKSKVLWASRFDSQKNPKIVAEIAAKMPDTQFLMYGRQVLGDEQINWETMPDNVENSGEFFNINELPIEECFAFLYTSKFDGTPNILLEIGSKGLPIVTPNIGGIAGFLGEQWPLYVDGPEDVDGYVAHLQTIQKTKRLAKTLQNKLAKILKSERSFDSFVKQTEGLILSSKGRKYLK